MVGDLSSNSKRRFTFDHESWCCWTSASGIDTIRSHAIDYITTGLAPAPAFPKNDGKQTPMKGHPVFIAQHATATCCRGWLWKWHRIEKGRHLKD